MKKILFASTILASLGSVAVAETGVSISGYGRFGLAYNGAAEGNTESTTVHTRLRLNINAKTETDSGVTFGGLIRLQHDSNNRGLANDEDNGTSRTSPAQLYAAYEGLRVEVGNVNSALDSSALFYDSEMGLTASSVGDALTTTYGVDYGYFSTGEYDKNRMGVAAFYSVGDFNIGFSYIDFDQLLDNENKEQEYSIEASYKFGAFTIAGAYTQDALGYEGNDVGFVGVAYAINDVANIGLNYIDEGYYKLDDTDTADVNEFAKLDDTITLYGNYTIDALTLRGVIAYNDTNHADFENEVAYGIGADYDLGGAKLLGMVEYDYFGNTNANFGVRFDF